MNRAGGKKTNLPIQNLVVQRMARWKVSTRWHMHWSTITVGNHSSRQTGGPGRLGDMEDHKSASKRYHPLRNDGVQGGKIPSKPGDQHRICPAVEIDGINTSKKVDPRVRTLRDLRKCAEEEIENEREVIVLMDATKGIDSRTKEMTDLIRFLFWAICI